MDTNRRYNVIEDGKDFLVVVKAKYSSRTDYVLARCPNIHFANTICEALELKKGHQCDDQTQRRM